MASVQSEKGQTRRRFLALRLSALEQDNPDLLEEALSLAAQFPHLDRQAAIDSAIRRCFPRHAIKILTYLLSHGVEPARFTPHSIVSTSKDGEIVKPSLEMLNLLIRHGWNISTHDTRGCNGQPLLWYVTDWPDLVDWCVEHGSSLKRIYDGPQPGPYALVWNGSRLAPDLLETVAASGTVEMFEHLRAKGAPYAPRALQVAVESACSLAPSKAAEPSSHYVQKMSMVRHLLGQVGAYPNYETYWSGMWFMTPLRFIAMRNAGNDISELVHMLLAYGADAYKTPSGIIDSVESDYAKGVLSARDEARSRGNTTFLFALEEWDVSRYEKTKE